MGSQNRSDQLSSREIRRAEQFAIRARDGRGWDECWVYPTSKPVHQFAIRRGGRRRDYTTAHVLYEIMHPETLVLLNDKIVCVNGSRNCLNPQHLGPYAPDPRSPES